MAIDFIRSPFAFFFFLINSNAFIPEIVLPGSNMCNSVSGNAKKTVTYIRCCFPVLISRINRTFDFQPKTVF